MNGSTGTATGRRTGPLHGDGVRRLFITAIRGAKYIADSLSAASPIVATIVDMETAIMEIVETMAAMAATETMGTAVIMGTTADADSMIAGSVQRIF